MKAIYETGELQRLLEQGAALIEVLPAADFRQSHIAGAENIPLTRLTAETVAHLDRRRPVAVYCNDFQ